MPQIENVTKAIVGPSPGIFLSPFSATGEANLEEHLKFNHCPACGKRVCDDCFVFEEKHGGVCKDCK
jgi:hypothetical protein